MIIYIFIIIFIYVVFFFYDEENNLEWNVYTIDHLYIYMMDTYHGNYWNGSVSWIFNIQYSMSRILNE